MSDTGRRTPPVLDDASAWFMLGLVVVLTALLELPGWVWRRLHGESD